MILVAPNFVTRSSKQSVIDFYDFTISSDIQKQVDEIVVFTSNTEEEDGHISLGMLQDRLSCKVVSLDNHGHYITQDMGTDEFPELLKLLIK